MFADAEAYERFMGRWNRSLAPLLIDFSGLSETGPVLNVGSGTGALASAIASQSPQRQVVGIDRSQQYVDYANSRNPHPDRARFEVGDAQTLRFPDSTFESSLSLLVFNFIPDAAQALREVSRVTKPGGCVSVAVWDYGDGMTTLRAFWDAAGAVDPDSRMLDEANMPLCRAGLLAELWRAGGLESVEERPLDFSMEFESFDDYWDPFLLGQGPAGAYVSKADPARRQTLRAELRRRLAIDAEDAPFQLLARAWAVRGIVPTSR